MTEHVIHFDLNKKLAFRRSYVYAIEIKRDRFQFEGKTLLVEYAADMLEILEKLYPDT